MLLNKPAFEIYGLAKFIWDATLWESIQYALNPWKLGRTGSISEIIRSASPGEVVAIVDIKDEYIQVLHNEHGIWWTAKSNLEPVLE